MLAKNPDAPLPGVENAYQSIVNAKSGKAAMELTRTLTPLDFVQFLY